MVQKGWDNCCHGRMVHDEARKWGKVICVWFLPWRWREANEGLKTGVAWSDMHFKVLTLTSEWVSECRSVVSDSLRPHELYPTRLLHPWDFPGKNTGVGYHFLLQEIFPTQGLNRGLPHCRQTLYRLSHLGPHLILMLKQEAKAGLTGRWDCGHLTYYT